MSGDWQNQPPHTYPQPFYHPQQPQGQYHQPHPTLQPVHYHQQPQVQPVDPQQYIQYSQTPQEFYYPQQGQPQPQSMHTRSTSRNVPVDPSYQAPQNLYGHQAVENSSRHRPLRSSANYGPNSVPQHVPSVAQRQTRGMRVNYKEEDEELVSPMENGGYGIDPLHIHEGEASYGVAQTSQSEPAVVKYDATANDTSNLGVEAPEEVEVAISKRGRPVRRHVVVESSDSEEEEPSRSRRLVRRGDDTFLAPDNEDDEDVDRGDDPFGESSGRLTRAKATKLSNKRGSTKKSHHSGSKKKKSSKRNRDGLEDDEYVDEDSAESSLGEEEERPTSPSLPATEDDEDDGNLEPKSYRFRSREGQPTNYNEIAAFERMEQNGAAVKKKSKAKKTKMNWTGKDYENAWGPLPGQSDSDTDVGKTPRKNGVPPGMPEGGMLAGGAGIPLDLAGTPSNLGRIGEAGLADADPLGVNTNVSFDDVGGLDEHVSKLKEMTLLPLLYPDMFQSLGVTPPRGVLFHGPPGTGKTLVARALAASCRSEGRSISFFMRKGADCLSKWVGEAERQLRLLFEEARKVQPSIIFFDEIDGLAPVRSSKQDQIHASIVSTLLALMDGMDGRGQVIVIGATNRPDAIDPALRRPGRFDREFYFPLPNFDARLKILEIMTKNWDNWKGEKGTEPRKRLARLTKGYGGADLRALCTEAALNAIQRQYPQIYQSSERLLLDHSKIEVQARDFMISVKQVVPSSARSTASAAVPLPPQLEPLLQEQLGHVTTALDKALPKSKKRSALEEAQWEEDHPDGEAGAFEREMMLQTLESQRVNRPRLLLYGESGMGQRAVGAAALHHLEGYSVQSFDLGTLTGDSARTPEAAIVQLFIEAKRHAPSIIYIPSLLALCSSLPETCRALVADSLESLDPHEPILLLAVLTGPLKLLPRDVKAWFGKSEDSRLLFTRPDIEKRRYFFRELLDYVKKPPSLFPDAVKRRRRILEVLPVAPPLPPREPTVAEQAAQERQDTLLFYKLKSHLNSIFSQCRKADSKFCRATVGHFTGSVRMEDGTWWGKERILPPLDSAPSGENAEEQAKKADEAVTPVPRIGRRPLHDIDMPRIHDWIWEGRYHTSAEFLHAVGLVRENAERERNDDDPESKDLFRRADKVFGVAQEEVARTEPMFNLETERMAKRFRDRQRKAQEAAEKERKASEAEATTLLGNEEDTAMDSVSPKEDGNSDERLALKRARDDAEGNGSDGPHPPSKRMRTSPFEAQHTSSEKAVRFSDLSSLPAIEVNGTAPPDSNMEHAYPPSPSPMGNSSNTVTNGVGSELKSSTELDVAPLGLTQRVYFTPSRTPTPIPSTPPQLNMSFDLLPNLEDTLTTKTHKLDVEQLEALRALCLNLVWAHKSDWDRDPLITKMISAVERYLQEMGEASDDDE